MKIRIADAFQRLENVRLLNLHILKNIVHSAASMAKPAVSPNRGLMIVLSYLWVLALIPLLLDERDAEVRWHAKHGIVLAIAEVILVCAYLAVTSFVSLATLALGLVLTFVFLVAWVGILAVHLVAILKGINGGRLIIPGLSEYATRF